MEEWITSRKNPKLGHLRKLSQDPGYRTETGLFLAEGTKLLQSAIQGNMTLELLLCGETYQPPKEVQQVPRIRVPEDLLAWISPMKSPQAVIFLGKTPSTTPPDTLPQGNYLVLDGVQDSGNVGTIWRTAQGLGATALILLEHCANPFSPKTIRSTMGASFHLPLYQSTRAEVVALFQQSRLPLYATALSPDSLPLEQGDLSGCGVVLGSEGQGVSPELLARCEKTFYLPMVQGCQSLNVGITAGIVLWEMEKQRKQGE